MPYACPLHHFGLAFATCHTTDSHSLVWRIIAIISASIFSNLFWPNPNIIEVVCPTNGLLYICLCLYPWVSHPTLASFGSHSYNLHIIVFSQSGTIIPSFLAMCSGAGLPPKFPALLGTPAARSLLGLLSSCRHVNAKSSSSSPSFLLGSLIPNLHHGDLTSTLLLLDQLFLLAKLDIDSPFQLATHPLVQPHDRLFRTLSLMAPHTPSNSTSLSMTYSSVSRLCL